MAKARLIGTAKGRKGVGGGGVIVYDNKVIHRRNAAMPQVRLQVAGVTDRIGHVAEAIFASHDRPGGHRIEIDLPGLTRGKLDGLVSMVGPDPLAVEFGHFESGSFGNQYGDDRRFIAGLHILQRALSAGRI